MTRKLTDEEVKLWQRAVKEGFVEQLPILREKAKEPPKARQPNSIDAKLDLHGYTIERAHKEFITFIYMCVMEEKHKLLVITGKGNPGKIREEFPKWCEADYLMPLISSCQVAAPMHGGAGAFYVTLRH